jgi:hypothetical protein
VLAIPLMPSPLAQVMCVEPFDANKHSANILVNHIYSDGTLCLTRNGCKGLPDMRQSFTQSVVWANGFTVWLQTKKFPWRYHDDE